MEVEIFFKDLKPSLQKHIADQFGKNIDDIEGEMNWDCFPITTIELGEECE